MQSQEDERWDDIRIFLAVHQGKSMSAAALRLMLDTSR
jgi:DNA-binding transcriptional LysR family regulator